MSARDFQRHIGGAIELRSGYVLDPDVQLLKILDDPPNGLNRILGPRTSLHYLHQDDTLKKCRGTCANIKQCSLADFRSTSVDSSAEETKATKRRPIRTSDRLANRLLEETVPHNMTSSHVY